MMMSVNGRCHCRGIHFVGLVDPGAVVICHCTDCQNITGTAYRVSVPSKAEDFRIVKGVPAIYVKRGGGNRAQAFCPTCASHLYTYDQSDDPPRSYGLRVGCLDERAHLPAQRQKWCDSALPWVMNISGLPAKPGD